MMEGKRITKEVPVIIYGGGEVGANCFNALNSKGYHVLAALDKNKHGDHVIEGIHTYKLGTESDDIDRSDCIVIICLANGMIHKNVADMLYSVGYSYILFLPMNYCMREEEKHKLTRIYNYVLSADTLMEEYDISDYAQYADPDISIESGIISRTSQYLTVWMGLEMLFSESLELWEGDKTKIHTKAEYKDKNIACGNPCEKLFDYYALRSDSYDVYFDSRKVRVSQEEKERELCRREELYRLFKREHGRGMNFFIEGAPHVVWNPDSYCNLVGGHHRTLYLLHEGHNCFPVKMRYRDFEKWCNKEYYDKLKKYIYEHNIQQFYAPLPHAGFLNFPVKWEESGETKLAAVLRFLANEDISVMSVLDCSNDEGYFARNLDRCGSTDVTFSNNNIEQIELADLFNKLLYRNNVKIRLCEPEEMGREKEFDIVFVLGRETKELIPQIALLKKLYKKYLILETAQAEETEYIRGQIGAADYTCIHREYRFGQVWEMGVYSKGFMQF